MNTLAYTITEEYTVDFTVIDEGNYGHKQQDEYCGYNAHQEVLDIDYEMCRPYSKYEEALLNDYVMKTEGY